MTKIKAAVQPAQTEPAQRHPDRVRTAEAPRRQGWLAGLYFRIAFYVCVLVWLLTCLAWSLPASLLYRILPRGRGNRLGQFAIMLGFRWFIGVMRATGVLRVDLTPLDALRQDGGIVIAPNHPTMLDAVLILSRLPRVVCIAKASLWQSWTLGGGIRLAAYLRNDAPLPMIRNAAASIRAGNQLLIFPEGSRTTRPPVDEFHRSFAVMARAAGAPVQTVLIEADSPYLRKGWSLFRRPVLPLVYRVRLGERFTVGADTDACVARIQAQFRAELPRPAAG